MTEARTLTLAEFLLERIAEDEAAARGAMLPGEYPHYAETAAGEVLEMAEGEGCAGWGIEHFKRHTPPRVLAECQAKRQMIARAERTWQMNPDLDWLLDALVLPYGDHPDCREEWRP